METFPTILMTLFIWTFSNVHCNEYVTVWSPKEAIARIPYEMYVSSSKTMDHDTEISVRFANRNITTMVDRNKNKHIKFPNSFDIAKDSTTISMILLRNETLTSTSSCYTQEVNISIANKRFLTFIQTDKPIYKPGDTINARIIVVNRNLLPQDVSHLSVELFAANSLLVGGNEFPNGFFGVQEVQLKISEFAIVGNWKLRVIVNNFGQFATTKIVPVQKYVLPTFEVVFASSDYNVFREESFTLTFFAQYPFDELVTGNAEVKLNIPNVKEEVKFTFRGIKEAQTLTINTEQDLKTLLPQIFEIILCKATLTFEEPVSQASVSKSLIITIVGNEKYKLRVTHNPKFLHGHPFHVKLTILDTRGRVLKKHGSKPRFLFQVAKYNGSTINGKLRQAVQEVMTYTILPEDDWATFKLEIQFVSSDFYRYLVEPGKVEVGQEGLRIDYIPMPPVIGENIRVFVGSDEEMDELYINIMNIQGTWNWRKIECDRQLTCVFDLHIYEKYFPESTLNVYHVKDMQHIYTGKVKITSSSLGSNELKMSMSSNRTTTQQKVTLKFETKPKSTVYVLAFDKRLTYLPSASSLLNQDIHSSTNEYIDGNYINVFSVDDSASWHDCTQEELEQVQNGRLFQGHHSGDIVYPVYGENETFTEELVGKRANEPDESDPDENFLNDNYPETWIFDKLSINELETSVSRAYKVPDPITTWMVSAFSTVEKHRLAVADSQELVVRNDFFMKINLPYSIRYKEVLRIDVLLYNYIPNQENLYVNVQLHNRIRPISNNKILTEFEFIEYEGKDFCKPTVANYTTAKEEVTVKYMSIERVSFFVRSRDFDNADPSNNLKRIQINVTAHALSVLSGAIHTSKVVKSIEVESIGVTTFSTTALDFVLKPNSDNDHEEFEIPAKINSSDEGDSSNFPGARVDISGAYMSIYVPLADRFTLGHGCLAQRTARLKGYLEYYRYQLASNINMDPKFGFEYIQSLQNEGVNSRWKYFNALGFRAFAAEAFITSYELGVVKDYKAHKSLVEEDLEYIIGKQLNNGTFEWSNFPGDHPVNSTVNSTIVFNTAYILLPFFKYNRHMSNGEVSFIDGVIKSIQYINRKLETEKLDTFAYSIGAYVLALKGLKENAERHINSLKDDIIIDKEGRKCYKLGRTYDDCDARHTAYVALALIEMNKKVDALPIVRWLLKRYNEVKLDGYNYLLAIIAEPVAKLASKLTIKNTDIRLVISNEYDYSKNLTINKENRNETITIIMPSFTRRIRFAISGEGYISIFTQYEGKTIFERKSDLFNITTKTEIEGKNRIVNVCIKYNKEKLIRNVMNEIEIPTGYQLIKVDEDKAVKLVEEHNEGSLVLLYYDSVENRNYYCSKVHLRRVHDVKNMQYSSVKVYDYLNHDDIAVEYYEIDRECSNT